MEDLKIVYWAENQVEADIISGLLKECDIPCTQMKESLGKNLGLNFGILGEIALAVPENRVAEAEAVILDIENNRPEEEAESEEEEN